MRARSVWVVAALLSKAHQEEKTTGGGRARRRTAAARKTRAADVTKGRNPALDKAPGDYDLAGVAARGRRTVTAGNAGCCDLAVQLAWAIAPATMTTAPLAYALTVRC